MESTILGLGYSLGIIGVVLKIMGPFWLQIVLRYLIFMDTRMGPQFGELPYYFRVRGLRLISLGLCFFLLSCCGSGFEP